MARVDRTAPEEEQGGRRQAGPRDRAEAVTRQRAMQKQLRAMFDKIVEEPLPDDFAKLLEEIGRNEEGAERKDDAP